MATPPRPVAAVAAVHPLETAMLAALDSAAADPQRDLVVTATDGTDPTVRALFLRAFLLERIPQSNLPIGRFVLNGASKFEVNERLDLSGIELKFLVRFTNCRFLGGIDLSDSKIIGFDLISGKLSELFADRLSASGSLMIRAPMPQESPSLPEPTGGPFVVSRRIRLSGATIHGNLDLRGCRLTAQHDPERVPLFADGLAVEGNVLLSNGFTADGEICINGSQISRNLDCSGATLRSAGRYSLSAAGAVIKGSVYLTKLEAPTGTRFFSIGTIRFDGAKISGDLDMSGGLFAAAPLAEGRMVWHAEEDDCYALSGDGLVVGGDMRFTQECAFRGSVSLINARIGGDLECRKASFDFPGEEIIVADGIDVSGTTFFKDTVANGIIRLVQAKLHQGFRAEGVSFDRTGTYDHRFDNDALVAELYRLDPSKLEGHRGLCGIYAPGVEVTGKFRWRNITKLSDQKEDNHEFWVYLLGSTVDTVEDQKESWEVVDRFDITGCRYDNISMPSNEFDWRFHELDRQYATLNKGTVFQNWIVAFKIMLRREGGLEDAIRRFEPQPYIQLARVVRQSGHEATAHRILVQLERNRTRYSGFGRVRQIARHILDGVLGYGFSKFRPIWIVLVWAVFSAFCFQAAYQRGVIVPSAGEHPRVTFNALVYAIDTLVPIVDLNQKKNWVVEPLSVQSRAAHIGGQTWCDWAGAVCELPDWGAGFLVFFNTFFGWIMTSFFVAGISGLLRTGREDG